MLRLAWRGVLAHKLRLALSGLAVVLGVAFVVGSYVLTDTLERTFDDLFQQVQAGTAVSVQGGLPLGGSREERTGVPAAVLEQVRALPGVAEAVGEVSGYAALSACPRQGDSPRPPLCPGQAEPVGSTQAPSLGVSWQPGSSQSALRLASGRPPQDGYEIAVDASTAESADLRLGDRLTVLLRSAPRVVTLTATVRFGSSGGLANATLIAFESSAAQTLVGTPGEYDAISVAAAPGADQAALVARVRAAVPPGLEVLTGDEAAAQAAEQTSEFVRIFRIFLLVFAAIALFVGLFIIANTFSILVAQRTRELALLRALGASRGQVTRSVVAEAAVVGLLGSTAGLGFGVLVALGLRGLFGALGVDLPTGPLQVLPRTIIAGYVVGMLATLGAALVPARRAGRVPPMAALRDDVALPERSLRRRAVLGLAGAAAGAGLLLLGLAEGRLPAVGLGAILVFLGVTALSPFIGRPVVRTLGLLLAARSPARRLGRANAARNPRRTAATSSALMVGIALVSTVTVVATSVQASLTAVFGTSVVADLVVQPASYEGFGDDVPTLLAGVPGVENVTTYRQGRVRVAGVVREVQAVDPGAVERSLALDLEAGSARALGRGQVLVGHDLAAAQDWSIGQTLPVEYAKTGGSSVVIGGIYALNRVAGELLWPMPLFRANLDAPLITVMTATVAPGRDVDEVQRAASRALANHPGIKVKTRQAFIDDTRGQVGKSLQFVVVLLLLAVIIAGLGIVNTLALSVVERTRELGLLRAVGAARSQVRQMIRTEAVLIAVYGGLLGAALGVVLGLAVVRALADEGFGSVDIPWLRLGGYVLAAGLLGVVAAALPARRAARLDVLAAIGAE